MREASFRTITNFAVCAVIIAALSLTHLAWGQGEQAEAEQVEREAPMDADVYSPPAMKLIPKGEYEMGNHSTNPRHDKLNTFALPVHTVSIDAFWMDVYELTNQKYCEYLNSAYSQGLIEVTDGIVHKAGDTENYCSTSGVPGEYSVFSQLHWDGNEFTITQRWENHPFVQVTWYGPAAFANWRSVEAGLTPCYDLETWKCDFDPDGLRLPTEAEWEKASPDRMRHQSRVLLPHTGSSSRTGTEPTGWA